MLKWEGMWYLHLNCDSLFVRVVLWNWVVFSFVFLFPCFNIYKIITSLPVLKKRRENIALVFGCRGLGQLYKIWLRV
jgi:hypothetical protein